MRTMILAGVLLAGLCVFPAAGRADLAPPVPEPKAVPVKIYLDEKAKESRIQVPQGLTTVWFRPRGVPPQPPSSGAVPPPNLPPGTRPLPPGAVPPSGDIGAPISEIEADVEYAPTPTEKNPNHLMIAGAALTMAFGCGGVWLLRRPDTSSLRGIVLLIASGVTLCGSTFVWANSAPPPRPPQPAKLDLPARFDGKMKLEVLTDGDTINIILDKATYAKLKEAK